ncbi:MAG: cytochrome c [Bacteroidetes bacterium]|nr:cytochrome c [Bacteroidota bacterium]
MQPLSNTGNTSFNKETAAQGRLVWQKYNCQSCHQLYSLGGYLGPDLTNVISQPKKGEALVRTMVKTGIKQMPAFTISEMEMSQLVEFLKSVDASGNADLRKFRKDNLGMIEAHENK